MQPGDAVDRWLLNTFPTWLLVFSCGYLPPLLTFGVIAAARHRWPDVAAAKYTVVGAALLGQAMGLIGFVLAFVIGNQYNDVVQARKDVQSEALNLEDLYRASLAFEEPAREHMVAAIKAYDLRVVDHEWDALRHGSSDAEATALVTHMYDVMRDYEPVSRRAQVYYGDASGYLHDVHENRHRRLDAAADALPNVLTAFLFVGAAAGVAVASLQGMHGHHLMLPLGMASLLGFTLFLSLSLEHPFSGDDAISSTHFREGSLAQFFETPAR